MMRQCIAKVVKGEDLTQEEMGRAMSAIMAGEAGAAQIGALLTALRIKGETVDEITGAAEAVRAKSIRVLTGNHAVNIDRDEINVDEETILDTCGTGGDGTCTFNVSTATAFVAAGAGVKVAKHGHRAVSSPCGSADVLESLGVNLDISTSDVERCIREIGIGFLYAPLFHGAMRHVASARQEIGIRTLFNLLGPLTNPPGASAQVLGVYEPGLTDKMARVLGKLGTREAFVVCGEGAFDEISICGKTRVSHLKEGRVNTFEMAPEDLGLVRARPQEIRGGDAGENARIIREILDGEGGAKRDMVLLNAAAAFVAAGLDQGFAEGLERAKKSIDSGSAGERLHALVSFTRACRPFLRNPSREFFPESRAA